MARRKDKEQAIQLRLKGLSYSQIKDELGVGKGTLSAWLSNYPLSKERIEELRDRNPRRIERYRETMRRRREEEMNKFYAVAKEEIGILSEREEYLAGLFLYWGEGGKTKRYSLCLSNTNPEMLRFFVRWLRGLGADKNKIKVRLQLYKDMNPEEEIKYWSKEIGLPSSQFGKPYVKKSTLLRLSYKVGHGHGTCNVAYDGKEIAYKVHMGLKYIKELCGS